MPIQSMTGFARSQGVSSPAAGRRYDWTWELRSVNGKSLDIRTRLPHGQDHLEPMVKPIFAEHFSRGNIQASLTLADAGEGGVLQVNQDVLGSLMAAAKDIQKQIDGAAITVDGLLAIKGVLETREAELSAEQQEALDADLINGLKEAVQSLAKARETEGGAVAAVLSNQVDDIERIVERVKSDPARSAEKIAERLRENVNRLMSEAPSLDDARLYQEAAVLATKADLREELDRLDAHVMAARDLLSTSGPIGRKLDFLSQEFNRECNTICSKSNAVSVTKSGLELKVVIDQLREQTQNIE